MEENTEKNLDELWGVWTDEVNGRLMQQTNEPIKAELR